MQRWWKYWPLLVIALVAGCGADAEPVVQSANRAPAPTTAEVEVLTPVEPPLAVSQSDIVVAVLTPGVGGDLITLVDESGTVLHEIDLDGSVWLHEVDYPERLIAVVSRDSEVERFVVNTASGEAGSLGVSESITEWGFKGQPAAGSRWYAFSSLRVGGSQELVDLEALSTRPIPTVDGLSSVVFSPDGDLLAFQESPSSIHVLETATFESRLLTSGAGERIEMIEFSPDGGEIVVTEFVIGASGSAEVRDLEPRVAVVDLATGESRPLIDGGFARGWLTDAEVIADSATADESLVVSSATGEIVSTTPHASLYPRVGAAGAPWHIAELGTELMLVERRTGETRAVELRGAMAPLTGVGHPPDQRYVWAYRGGTGGANNELDALVIDTFTGETRTFLAPNEGGFIGATSFALSADGSQAIAATAGSSFLLAANGTLKELPAARAASFCDDGRFVLSAIDGERTDVMLFDAGGTGAASGLGSAPVAICAGG